MNAKFKVLSSGHLRATEGLVGWWGVAQPQDGLKIEVRSPLQFKGETMGAERSLLITQPKRRGCEGKEGREAPRVTPCFCFLW